MFSCFTWPQGLKRPVGMHATAVPAAPTSNSATVPAPQKEDRTAAKPIPTKPDGIAERLIRKPEVPPFVVSGEYDTDAVGPAGMALQDPAWTVPPSATIEKSISMTKGTMCKVLRDYYDNAEAFRFVKFELERRQQQQSAAVRDLKRSKPESTTSARNALRNLKMPQTVQVEFVRACIAAGMPVPLVTHDWQALWREVGAAFMAMLSIHTFQDKPDSEFGQNASILFRDRSKRAYTFTAVTDSSRRVYVNVGIPHCEGQGIGAVCGRAALDKPITVHHPIRACAADGGSKLVVLDVPPSMKIPDKVAMHHREGNAGPNPARTSFEGDNMLMVPCFRRHVFTSIARLALEMVELRAWQALGTASISAPVAAQIHGFVNPDLSLVVSNAQDTKIDVTTKPWVLESRF
eukprot:jgi/Ulvmu1/2880/UM146_0022.1